MVKIRPHSLMKSISRTLDRSLKKKQDEIPRKDPEIGKNEKSEDDVVIDKLFDKICWFCMMLGVNFNKNRSTSQKILSAIIMGIAFVISLYFILYVAYLTYRKPHNKDVFATSLARVTWTLQATLSTLFIAHWQAIGAPCEVIKEIYQAQKLFLIFLKPLSMASLLRTLYLCSLTTRQRRPLKRPLTKGAGIHQNRHSIVAIVRSFYVLLFSIFVFKTSLMYITWNQYKIGFVDQEIVHMFGDHRLFIILQLVNLYIYLCWAVALFVYVLLIKSANAEFVYFNGQIQTICCPCEENICGSLLEAMKVHTRLVKCVKRLDRMFNRYAFVMIATIIPTVTFGILAIVRRVEQDVVTRCIDLIFAVPLIGFFVFSFYAVTGAPAQLHENIHKTKAALCANPNVWHPFRPNVYLSAAALVSHLDQPHLGVSIWGFHIITKPFVLTTLSVMMTCLAMFMEF